MSVFFMARGTCTMGETRRDKYGNIVSVTPARFNFDSTGGCVAIGDMDPETTQPRGENAALFGDWDAAGYLAKILELLSPNRTINIPDFKAMFQAAYKDGTDFCDHCRSLNLSCNDCIVQEWKEEMEGA